MGTIEDIRNLYGSAGSQGAGAGQQATAAGQAQDTAQQPAAPAPVAAQRQGAGAASTTAQPVQAQGQPAQKTPAQPASKPAPTAMPQVDWSTGRVTQQGRDPMAAPVVVPAAKPAPAGTVQGTGNPWLSFTDLFLRTAPAPPSKEELERQRRKERREKTFAAIGDGISALSNLFFTTRYAPNVAMPPRSASERTRSRWAKIAADQEAARQAYLKGLTGALMADREQAGKDREWRLKLGLAEAQEARDEEMHELDKQLMDGKITEQQHKAGKAAVEEKYAPVLAQSLVEQRRASASASRASAAASRERAAKIRTDRRAGGKTITLQMPDGSTESVHIPKENWNEANITKLYWLLGGKPEVDDGSGRTSLLGRSNSGKRAPTTEEMEQFIGRNLQVGNAMIKNMDEALEYLEGLQADE